MKYRIVGRFEMYAVWTELYDLCPYCGDELDMCFGHTLTHFASLTIDAESEEHALIRGAKHIISQYESRGWAIDHDAWIKFDIRIVIDPEKLHGWTHGLPIKGN